MSVIKARLRKQAAEFISLREVFELLMKDGEGCTLADAAKFIYQAQIVDFIDFMPDFLIYDYVDGFAVKATPEQSGFFMAEIRLIASGVLGNSLRGIKFDCDGVGFKRSELISFMGLHGISIAGATEQSSQAASDDERERLHQLEAENVRLAEQVTELQRQLQEATAAAQRAPQEAAPTPQEATATPQQAAAGRQDDDRPLATKERNTLLKLVIGMATAYHGYDPCAKRSGTAASIVSELARLEIGIEADTVRKYLKEAAETVMPADAIKQ